MKKARFIIALLLVISNAGYLYAQKQANIWYFGSKAGLNFNNSPPTALTNGKLDNQEGCAVMSDANGQLLFYTDGIKVWDKSHNVMPNGTGLGGCYSSTQGALIVPRPGSSTQYYIFTVDAWAGQSTRATGNGGMNLNLVDLSLHGGLGDVTTKAQKVVSPTCEKLTATRHCNGTDYWVVTHLWGSDSIAAYLLTATGLSATPVISHSTVVMKNVAKDTSNEANGYLRISSNGKKIGFAVYSSIHCIGIGDFDNKTGIASNFIVDATLPFTPSPLNNNNTGIYGFEFSPDNTKVYVSSQFPFNVFQYDLLAGNTVAIFASRILIASSTTDVFGALQLAPDEKIYVAKVASAKLDVIENPNVAGVACNYITNSITCGDALHTSEVGLPNFIESLLIPKYKAVFHYEDCNGTYDVPFVDSGLAGPVTIAWDFGDPSSGASNSSTLDSATHTFSAAGNYIVKATVTYPCGSFSISENVNVVKTITVDAGPNLTIQQGQSVVIQANSSATANYTWTPPLGLDNPNTLQPTASPQQTTVYTIHVTGNAGCTGVDSMTVFVDTVATPPVDTTGTDTTKVPVDSTKSHGDTTVIHIPPTSFVYFPNAFSPNGDGINDKFIYYEYRIKSVDLKIFNRWGQLIFESANIDYNWDGTFNGKPEPIGTYVYEAQVVDIDGNSSVLKGNLTLLR